MVRLTTPIHSFSFETDPSLYERLLITYKQGRKIVLEKEKDDLVIEERADPQVERIWIASFKLTQEETKAFNVNTPVQIQVRALMADGTALASEMYTIAIADVLNDEVLI